MTWRLRIQAHQSPFLIDSAVFCRWTGIGVSDRVVRNVTELRFSPVRRAVAMSAVVIAASGPGCVPVAVP
jgi:hypothetical protein